VALLTGIIALSGCADSIAGPDRAPTSGWVNSPDLSRAGRDDRDRDDRDDDDEKARRLVGQCVTTFQFLDETRLQIGGTCEFKGLGRMTLSATETVTPGPNGVVIGSTSTYTAANGDELKAAFIGFGVPDATGRVCFTGTNTFRGGTGRFRRAVREAAVEGCASFTSPSGGTGFFSVKGRISLGKPSEQRR
jgi:hypothetical protein